MSVVRPSWLVAIAIAFVPVPTSAQSFVGDGRPITLVAPVAAGGGLDVIARLIADKLHERLKQPVVVENRVGGGGAVGADSVAKAAPDGRTLLLIQSATILHKWLQKDVAFDVIADFAPISRVASASLLLFAHPSFPPNNPQEVIAYARAHPDTLTVGTPGIGSPHHLAMLMMNSAAKLDITHVPYRGIAPALNDLLGGQLPMVWSTPVVVMPHLAAGRVKALGTASGQREAALPRVPTMQESGLPGFRIRIFYGVAAPAKTPVAVLERLDREIRDISAISEVRERMAKIGFDPSYADANAFREEMTAEYRRYGEIIRAAAIEPN